MAQYTSTIRGPGQVVSNSYVQSVKPNKMSDIHDNRLTDHSVFIGYGSSSKRVKDRWEAMKKQFGFENNYVALKWLLDSFVDDYLRTKNMDDTATLTREVVPVKREPRERRIDEVCVSQSRRPSSHSPSKTRFEEVIKENGIKDKSLHSSAYESRQHASSLREHRSRGEASRSTGDLHIAGQYPYKYVQDYWSPYYQWHGGNVPSRIMNMGYPTARYIMKTPSCSSLPTQDAHKLPGGLRSSESLKQLNSKMAKGDREEQSTNEKRPAVNLGFKTKSMPNLQFIPKENEPNSEEDEEIESDPESQGDLMALSSLSMPNLRKIPPDHRAPLLSPPTTRGHYEPAPLLRDRHEVCSASSFSMPNLQAIQGMRADDRDDRKKTIRDFVMNRLERTSDHDEGDQRSKMFNPNGYYPPSAMRDSERKLVIRERLLNRMAKRKREENTRVETRVAHHNGKVMQVAGSHFKFAKKLPHVPESRPWPEKGFVPAPARTLGKDDLVNNNWKVPQAIGAGSSERQRSISPRHTWNRSPAKKSPASVGIWNPADVHVKIENPSVQFDGTAETSSSGQAVAEERPSSRPSSTNDAKVAEVENRSDEDDEGGSGDEEEHVDVENVKEDEMEESGESESEQDGEDASDDEDKKNKRARKTDKPRKRLKAM